MSQVSDLINYAVNNKVLTSVWCNDGWHLYQCDNYRLLMDVIDNLDGTITLNLFNNRYGNTGYFGSVTVCSTNQMILDHSDTPWFDDWLLRGVHE